MELKNYRERKAKFGGGSVMVWRTMTWNGTGKLEYIDGVMGSEVYVNILNKNLLASTQKLRIEKHFIFHSLRSENLISKTLFGYLLTL